MEGLSWHEWKNVVWDVNDKKRFCCLLTFVKESHFQIILSGIPSEYQMFGSRSGRHFVCKGYQETTKVPAYQERISGHSYKCDWCYFVSPIFIGGAICLSSISPIFIGGVICLTSISAAQCRFWMLILALPFKPKELEKCLTTYCTCLRFGVNPCSDWIFTLSLPPKTFVVCFNLIF